MVPAAAIELPAGDAALSLPWEDRTLVIVDMQYQFPASRKSWVLSAVERLIVHAKCLGWGIVVLELSMSDEPEHVPTYGRLTDHLSGYARYLIKIKTGESGAPQVVEASHRPGFEYRLSAVRYPSSQRSLLRRATGHGLRLVAVLQVGQRPCCGIELHSFRRALCLSLKQLLHCPAIRCRLFGEVIPRW